MKSKISLSLFLFLFLITSIFSQTYVYQVKKKGSKRWGYANLEGVVIVKPKYQISYEFNEQGYALVYKHKFLLINIKGEVIKTEMDKLKPNKYTNTYYASKRSSRPHDEGRHSYSDGYLLVKDNNKLGCLSSDGRIAIPIKYNRLTDFNGGYALAEIKNNFFVLDKNGNEFPISVSNIKEIKPFSEGLGCIEVKGERWGFVDSTGKVAIEPQFARTGYFNGGLAWARNDKEKIGFINKKGEWVIEPQFSMVQPFDPESGMAMVKVDNKWGYVDMEGNISFFEQTEKTYSFTNGLARGRKNGKVGFLNNKGEWAIEPQFDIAYAFKNGYAGAAIDELFGIIDKEGNWVVEPAFKGIGDVTVVEE